MAARTVKVTVLPGKTLSSDDLMWLIRQNRWLILVPFAVGLAIAPLIAKDIPEVYRSETLIMIVPQRVPESYVKSTVTEKVEDRLPSISDQILSRSRLERIINDFKLYPELRARAPMEDVVRHMRADIGPPQIKEGAQSFRVSYVNANPVLAQKVTARLASLFIDENSRDRENLAESTNVFLESQLEDAKRRLVEQEKKLQEYRQQHAGELPTETESNLRAIQSAQMQIQSVTESANHARERRLLVERQLVDAKTQPMSTPLPVALGSPESQASLTTAQQLEIAQHNLSLLKLRYKDEHPEVRKMERNVAELQARVEEEARRPKPPVDKTPSPSEQARLARIRDLEADLAVIDHQLTFTQSEQARLNGMIADYQRKVEAAPKRESELVELTRDYEVLKKSYDSLLGKREDSKLAANLERRQIGEQFRVLDEASLPVRPSNQFVRLGLSFSGAGVGLVLGLLVAGLKVFRDSSFSREDDVMRLLEVPVLALVPVMISDSERLRERRRTLALDVGGTAVMLMSAVVLVMWGLRQF